MLIFQQVYTELCIPNLSRSILLHFGKGFLTKCCEVMFCVPCSKSKVDYFIKLVIMEFNAELLREPNLWWVFPLGVTITISTGCLNGYGGFRQGHGKRVDSCRLFHFRSISAVSWQQTRLRGCSYMYLCRCEFKRYNAPNVLVQKGWKHWPTLEIMKKKVFFSIEHTAF